MLISCMMSTHVPEYILSRKFSSKTSKLRTDVQGHFCHHVHHIVSESSSRVGAVEKSNSSGTRDFTGESHSFIYSFFLSFIHSVFHSLMHACVHAFIHPSYHFISSHFISFHFSFVASFIAFLSDSQTIHL